MALLLAAFFSCAQAWPESDAPHRSCYRDATLSCLPVHCDPATVLIIAGQSQAEGASNQAAHSYTSDLTCALRERDGLKKQISDPNIHLTPSQDPVGLSSAWPKFTDLWIAGGHGPLAILATAFGATCLASGTLDWDPATGTRYARMIEAAGRIYPPHRIRAVFWWQGECDGVALNPLGYDVAKATYKAALKGFADAVWSDLGVNVIASPVGLRNCLWANPDCVGSPDPDQPHLLAIHDATSEAATEHDHIFLGPHTDDIRVDTDNVHLYDVVEAGTRWYQAYLNAVSAGL